MFRTSFLNTYAGLQVSVSKHATETVPRFPDKPRTKRRRRRVVGKYGSWFVTRPAAYRYGSKLIVHPTIYARLQAEFRANANRLTDELFYPTPKGE